MSTSCLVRVLCHEIQKMVQRTYLSSDGGAFLNLMLKEACDRNGEELKAVKGVCAAPHADWFQEWAAPHVWLEDKDGNITDLEAGIWGPFFVSFADMWFDPNLVRERLELSSGNPEQLFQMYNTIVALHEQAFPFKVPLIKGSPQIPPVENVPFSSWQYATGEVAIDMISEKHRHSLAKELSIMDNRISLAIETPQLLFSSSSEAEELWYEMERVLDAAAEEWRAVSA